MVFSTGGFLLASSCEELHSMGESARLNLSSHGALSNAAEEINKMPKACKTRAGYSSDTDVTGASISSAGHVFASFDRQEGFGFGRPEICEYHAPPIGIAKRENTMNLTFKTAMRTGLAALTFLSASVP